MQITGLIVAAVTIATLATAVMPSCLARTDTFVCASGRRCPVGQVCAAHEDVCITEHGCGDGVREGNEICDDGNIEDGDGCSHDCKSMEVCGNKIVDQGEDCDGQPNCSLDCHFQRCGNGILDPGEVCDDGNVESGDGCSADCMSNEACGNGIVDTAVGEECEFSDRPFPHHFDDTVDCDNDCTKVVCGDGHTNKAAGEQCDPGIMVDGNAMDSEGCDSDCTFVKCGDGHLNHAAGEQCDLGSMNSDLPDAACRKNCLPRSCGDGIVDSDEECDDGNDLNNDFCVTIAGKCKVATCGDGLIRTMSDPDHPAETCDPGAQQDGHDAGCSSEQPTCADSGPDKCRRCL